MIYQLCCRDVTTQSCFYKLTPNTIRIGRRANYLY